MVSELSYMVSELTGCQVQSAKLLKYYKVEELLVLCIKAHPVSYSSLKKSLNWAYNFFSWFYLCRLQIVHQHLNMDSSIAMVLTPFNYHEWKLKISILLRSKGLYRVSIALEKEPNFVVEKAKWHNRLDEAYGFLWLSIYPDLLFNISGLTTPYQVCTKIESLFGV